jgi:23S rRNA (guanosine2251-2'-O)-methyltransferase
VKREVVFGWHAVLAALERHPQLVEEVWLDDKRAGSRAEAIQAAAQAARIPIQRVPRHTLDELSGYEVHQGVVARRRAGESAPQDLPDIIADAGPRALLLVLDGVQDPHNLGACLRSAEAAGVDAVILPKDNASPVTPVVRKVAAGAAEIVPVFMVTNLARTLDEIKAAGVWVVGLAGEAEQTLYEVELAGPLALVLGAEETGLRRLTRERCDFLARIPMAGQVESLNVSVATGVVLFEAVRQRSALPDR